MIIPQPKTCERRPGSLKLEPDVRVVCTGSTPADLAALLAEYLRPATGWPWPVSEGALPRVPLTTSRSPIILLEQTGQDEPDAAGFCTESYTLEVTTAGTRLSAPTSHGLARGIQTLRQLFALRILAPTTQDGPWEIPCVRIDDAPRFRWRGMHLDVARHFFTVEQVERFIDLLALHKFNRLHLHLTDDQGWRIEIRRYPRLTEIGSIRPGTLVGHEGHRPRRYDDRPHSGFYTQADIRRLVTFAARRRIEIVPEIDMPGHMQAAIAAYPELGNTGLQLTPRCHWGVSQHILNVEAATVQFMQHVLDEVIELFPGRFIHIGGDEAVKQEWAESRRAQDRMAELGLTGEDQLQNWFIHQMTQHIVSRSRRMIGWDEILEGGFLPAGAAVMSWRGEEGGLRAARDDFDVVMAPNQFVYFDHYQAEPVTEEPLAIGGLSTTAHVYSYEPVPAALPPAKHPHVLGAQGQLWTEYIKDNDSLDYMTFPRACALAEVLWLPAAQKNYRDFLRRLSVHRERFQVLGVNTHPQP